MNRTFYHGTSLKEWQSIQHEGLIPGKGHGADYWIGHTEEGREHDALLMVLTGGYSPLTEHRTPSVFLGQSPDDAQQFAGLAAQVNSSKPVVLRVELTPEQRRRLVEDEYCEGAYRYPGTIPPTQISLVADRVATAGVGE